MDLLAGFPAAFCRFAGNEVAQEPNGIRAQGASDGYEFYEVETPLAALVFGDE